MTTVQKFRLCYITVIMALGLGASLYTGYFTFFWSMCITSLLIIVSGVVRDGGPSYWDGPQRPA